MKSSLFQEERKKKTHSLNEDWISILSLPPVTVIWVKLPLQKLHHQKSYQWNSQILAMPLIIRVNTHPVQTPPPATVISENLPSSTNSNQPLSSVKTFLVQTLIICLYYLWDNSPSTNSTTSDCHQWKLTLYKLHQVLFFVWVDVLQHDDSSMAQLQHTSNTLHS